MAQMSKIEKSISESFAEKEHSISLVNRSKMSLSGVNDVSEFSDSQVMLKTSMGGLCIKGKNLSINPVSYTHLPILRIRKNYRFVMQWAIFSNSYLSTLVKRKMLFPKIYCC